MTRKDLNGYKIPHNPNQKRGGRCSKADHGPQVIDRPCPKCGFQWGGGRESGNPGSVGGAESTRAAAANPAAACPLHRPSGYGAHREHDDRIRELEAQLALVKGQNEALEEMYQAGTSLAAWKARAEKAETELRDYKVTLAIARKMRDEAEACVKELALQLTAHFVDKHGFTIPEAYEAKAELRGEDGPDPDEKECLG